MDVKHRFFWPLMTLALLLGVGLGSVLAWQVWPVRWYDTDPSDLRQDHQMAYITLVADSLVVTGDAEAAQRQLYELIDDDTTPDEVGALVHRTMTNLRAAGNQAAALRVQRMIQQVGLPAISDQQAPPTPVSTQAARPKRPIPTKYLYGGAIALFVIALALAIWGIRRLVKSQAEERDYADPDGGGQVELGYGYPAGAQPGGVLDVGADDSWDPDEPPDKDPSMELAGTAARRATIGGGHSTPYADTEHTDDAYAEGAMEPASYDIESMPPENAGVHAGIEAIDAPETPVEPRPAPRASAPAPRRGASRRRSRALGVFEPKYRHGGLDYDRSFRIDSEQNAFLGECGVSICDVLGAEGSQQVNALEVWLYDKDDHVHQSGTVSKMYTSRYSEQHETIADELSARGEWVVAAPGLTTILETTNMRATIIVQTMGYIDDPNLPEAYFEFLNLEIVVEKV